MTGIPQVLEWTAQFKILQPNQHIQLHGDKILLPPSALERLLAAAPVVQSDSAPSHSANPSFDPFNPHSFAAERHARHQSQFQQQQLPHPLTFRLVNPRNGHVVYAGIQEFSAEEGFIGLSPFLIKALGMPDHLKTGQGIEGAHINGSVEDSSVSDTSYDATPLVTVHAKQLPKGTFVKLRPLEAGYDVDDWKALLEQHLRKSFTTLTRRELLNVPAGRDKNGKPLDFEFLIDEFVPNEDGICVIDTDLEVDIEALNEDQARETLKRIAAKIQKAPGTKEGSSTGGELRLFKEELGQVLDGEYVDYTIPSWDRAQGLEIELSVPNDHNLDLELFVSPFSTRQRHKPRDDEHACAEFEGRLPKRIKLSPTNMVFDSTNAEAILVSIHAPATELASRLHLYNLRVIPYDSNNNFAEAEKLAEPLRGDDEVRCENCRQYVPRQSLMLHQNFCFRNNILCPKGCDQVFQKRSEEWQNHWHCPRDSSYGSTPVSQLRHDFVFHEEHTCDSCGSVCSTLPQLAFHKTTICPGKPILCSFCHLEVPQEGDPDEPNTEALFAGLTVHELNDGARTTECHLCQKIVRLRDMVTHMKFHSLERLSRDTPRLCRNVLCGRTLDGAAKNGDTRAGSRMGQGSGNDIGLCSVCFGPLYVSMYDPEGKALRRRVERKYLTQLLSGCGQVWCRNKFCKNGRKVIGIDPSGAAVPTKIALPIISPFVDGLAGGRTPLHFCVDDASQKRRDLAQMIYEEEKRLPGKTGYDIPWCVAGLEAENNDIGKARDWLYNFAPQIGEAR